MYNGIAVVYVSWCTRELHNARATIESRLDIFRMVEREKSKVKRSGPKTDVISAACTSLRRSRLVSLRLRTAVHPSSYRAIRFYYSPLLLNTEQKGRSRGCNIRSGVKNK